MSLSSRVLVIYQLETIIHNDGLLNNRTSTSYKSLVCFICRNIEVPVIKIVEFNHKPPVNPILCILVRINHLEDTVAHLQAFLRVVLSSC